MMNRRAFLRLSALASAGALAGTYPVCIERYLIQINRYTIRIPRLPEVFNGFTIVQLTDLHYGLLQPLFIIRNVIDRANHIPREIIACTGDYVHQGCSQTRIDRIWPLLAELKAPNGVYSILGNHDHWADTGRSCYWLERSGQNLRHRTVCVERSGKRIWFAGAGDLWEDHMSIQDLLGEIPHEEVRIVLAHNPDTADTANDAHVDLFICGHTHGGQVRLPFLGAPVVPVNNKNYTSGLKLSKHNRPVFISRGIGWAILPVRFNCFPEIAVLTLTNA